MDVSQGLAGVQPGVKADLGLATMTKFSFYSGSKNALFIYLIHIIYTIDSQTSKDHEKSYFPGCPD